MFSAEIVIMDQPTLAAFDAELRRLFRGHRRLAQGRNHGSVYLP